MEQGDVVLIDYVGKTSDGDIFDISNEERAREEGVYSDEVEYRPVPVLIGSKYVIEGLEDKIAGMEPGDKEENIQIPSEEAYGQRESDKIQTYPEKEFKKQDVNVRVGDEVMVGNRKGKVLSNSSGRVRVDFNHPLSGEDLVYEVEIVDKVEDDEEKARQIFRYRLGHGDLNFEDDKVEIDHSSADHDIPGELKQNVREEILNSTNFNEVNVKDKQN